MVSLADRISALRSRSQRVRDVAEWDAILTDVRELESAARAGRDALAGLNHGAGCGLSDEAMRNCSNCRAHTKLTAALTKTKGST